MKDFKLDDNNDILISGNDIELAHGIDVTIQAFETTLETQKGEWFLNNELGINFDNVLGKPIPSEEITKDELNQGIAQVNEDYNISGFSTAYDNTNRSRTITLELTNNQDETIPQITISYE